MMNETTRTTQYSTFPTLYLAFELGSDKWKLGFTIGLGQSPRERTIAARATLALQTEIRLARVYRCADRVPIAERLRSRQRVGV